MMQTNAYFDKLEREFEREANRAGERELARYRRYQRGTIDQLFTVCPQYSRLPLWMWEHDRKLSIGQMRR